MKLFGIGSDFVIAGKTYTCSWIGKAYGGAYSVHTHQGPKFSLKEVESLY